MGFSLCSGVVCLLLGEEDSGDEELVLIKKTNGNTASRFICFVWIFFLSPLSLSINVDRYGRQLFFLGPSVSGLVGAGERGGSLVGEIPVMPLMAFFGRSKLWTVQDKDHRPRIETCEPTCAGSNLGRSIQN